MHIKNCPICNSRKNSILIYQEKLPENLIDANFAGRKDPDGYHYKMLRCSNCTLLYASEIYDEEYSNQTGYSYAYLGGLSEDEMKRKFKEKKND